MNRIEKTFDHLRVKGDAALVGFVTAGDPDPETSAHIIRCMCSAGVDLLELGIPFSDPTADGPTIQCSSERALAQGMNLKRVLDLTRRTRAAVDTPVILFSYYNPIFRYGTRAFYTDALEAGADGVLVVDLPPEEAPELVDCWSGQDLALIRLIAPSTTLERSRCIAANAGGFLYLVSKAGVTGSDGLDPIAVADSVARLKPLTRLPICVGFGVSQPEDVIAIAAVADGVVIGSAFEQLIEENLNNPDVAEVIARQVRRFKAATCRCQRQPGTARLPTQLKGGEQPC
jgi:tryptophan synthase alpha chain